MERRLLVGRITRLFLIAVVVTAIGQHFTPEARAQTILPLAIERVIAPHPVNDFNAEMAAGSVHGGINNLDVVLDAELRKSLFLLALVESAQDEQTRRAAETAGAASQDPSIPQPKDDRWRNQQPRFNWDGALKQSAIFLGIQHAFRLATEEGSRAELKGPFFKDYLKALRSLRGWNDGDPFIVNYIGHPMMGSVSGFIQIQNDPNGINEEVSLKKSYWMSRLRATAWSFAYSTQFELGLVGEAGLGNIGIRQYGGRKHPMAYIDLVVTPIVGTSWLVGEDTLDKYFINRFESRLPNRTTVILVRSFLNPTRSFANMMRGKWPWHRDNRP